MMTMTGESMYCFVNISQYETISTQENFFLPHKEIIQLRKCVLNPPNFYTPCLTSREKPLGCKTVFVGGLPEKATHEIVKEIFERCGTVETIRMSNRICHIRFSNEIFVENALYFSGYRLNIENKDEAPYTGTLHVDYAQARDDQYDYEWKQQAQHKEQDYRSAAEVDYTDHEVLLICEKLKNEETFSQAADILITWLKRGECTKWNSHIFYSIIQSIYNHVRKLHVDKVKYEDQVKEVKKMLKNQFTDIGKIYEAASLQKCWNHTQRKNIEVWKKETEELKNAYIEEIINEKEYEIMELIDYRNISKKDIVAEHISSQYEEHILKLQNETDSLKCQLEASKTEIIRMHSNHQEEINYKDNQISVIETALQNLKKEVQNLREKCAKDEARLKELYPE